MSDFDTVTIPVGGPVLASIEPNVADLGGGPIALGGAFYCRDRLGNIAVAVEGGTETPGPGGGIRVYDGSVNLFNQQQQLRVALSSNDGAIDGGMIALYSPQSAINGPEGASIVLDAGNRSITVRDEAGRDVVALDGEHAALYLGAFGNDGDIIVRDKAGKDVFTVDGQHAALYLGAKDNDGDLIVRDKAGKDVFTFDGEHAALYIGAKDNDGDIIIRDDAGVDSIRLDGNTGDITTRNERKKKVEQNQHVDLFGITQDGAFIVELAASYSYTGSGGLFRGSSYRRWVVFTYEHAGNSFDSTLTDSPELVDPVSGPGFWEGSPELSEAGGNVRLSIPEVKQQEFKGPRLISNATLSVKALYGTLLSF